MAVIENKDHGSTELHKRPKNNTNIWKYNISWAISLHNLIF